LHGEAKLEKRKKRITHEKRLINNAMLLSFLLQNDEIKIFVVLPACFVLQVYPTILAVKIISAAETRLQTSEER